MRKTDCALYLAFRILRCHLELRVIHLLLRPVAMELSTLNSSSKVYRYGPVS